MRGNESEIVKLNVALCNAVGITSIDRCSGFDLKVRPGQIPVVIATYQIKDSDGLSGVFDEFKLVQSRGVVFGADVGDGMAATPNV